MMFENNAQGRRILQFKVTMKTFLLISCNNVVQNFFGMQTKASAVSVSMSDCILLNQNQNLPPVVRNRGYRGQFQDDLMSWQKVMQLPLWIFWSPQIFSFF